jgi:pyridoxine 5-phosphate synthase
MPRLHINVDHIATLRQARRTTEPDPVYAALLAEQAGADGITLHLREDRRHIQDRDLELCRRMLQTCLNLEMGATDEMLAIALKQRPEICTLVPEKREEVTTEGGLDLIATQDKLRQILPTLQGAGIRVSLFIDPTPAQIEMAQKLGADDVELHTGEYANASGLEQQKELKRLKAGATLAAGLGLQVNAGHGLTYFNVRPVAAIPELSELNIGHSIISRAAYVGIGQAVREMIALLDKARA